MEVKPTLPQQNPDFRDRGFPSGAFWRPADVRQITATIRGGVLEIEVEGMKESGASERFVRVVRDGDYDFAVEVGGEQGGFSLASSNEFRSHHEMLAAPIQPGDVIQVVTTTGVRSVTVGMASGLTPA